MGRRQFNRAYQDKQDPRKIYTVQGYENGFRLIRKNIEAGSDREAIKWMRRKHKNITNVSIVRVEIWQDTTR